MPVGAAPFAAAAATTSMPPCLKLKAYLCEPCRQKHDNTCTVLSQACDRSIQEVDLASVPQQDVACMLAQMRHYL